MSPKRIREGSLAACVLGRISRVSRQGFRLVERSLLVRQGRRANILCPSADLAHQRYNRSSPLRLNDAGGRFALAQGHQRGLFQIGGL